MIDTEDLQPHDYAGMFPQMLPDEYTALVADIQANGQQEPIVLFEGLILDGRHCYQALSRLGVEAETRQFHGTKESALRYVFSVNLYRRHLTVGQRACLGVDVKRTLQETGVVQHGGDRRSEDFQECKNTDLKTAASIAASTVNVSERSVYKAEKVQEEAPDLFERVRAGEMPLSAAENALAIRNGTQTQAQAIKAVAAEVVAQMGIQNVTEENLETMSIVVMGDTGREREGEPCAALDAPYLDAARKVMGNTFCTIEAEALPQAWTGCVWLYPPAAALGAWLDKLAAHLLAGDVTEAVVLASNATQSSWFQSFASLSRAFEKSLESRRKIP